MPRAVASGSLLICGPRHVGKLPCDRREHVVHILGISMTSSDARRDVPNEIFSSDVGDARNSGGLVRVSPQDGEFLAQQLGVRPRPAQQALHHAHAGFTVSVAGDTGISGFGVERTGLDSEGWSHVVVQLVGPTPYGRDEQPGTRRVPQTDAVNTSCPSNSGAKRRHRPGSRECA